MTSTSIRKSASPDGTGSTAMTETVVQAKDTVGAVVDGMPMVAATPFLVTIAEVACYRLAETLLEPGQITVGSRVVIDHLGPSKVGAVLVTQATLKERNKNRFLFTAEIKDGDRLVANVEHTRAAVSLEKLKSALG